MEASNPWLPLALHLHCVAQQHKEWHANVMERRLLCMSSSNCLFPPAKKKQTIRGKKLKFTGKKHSGEQRMVRLRL